MSNETLNAEKCLELYQSKIDESIPQNLAVTAVCKALLHQANQTPIEESNLKTAKGAYSKAHDIFVAFARRLFETNHVYVNKYHLIGYLKVVNPIMFEFLHANNFRPAREYNRTIG